MLCVGRKTADADTAAIATTANTAHPSILVLHSCIMLGETVLLL